MGKVLKMVKFALMALGMAAFASSAQAEYTDDCITFSSEASFTLATANASKNWDGTLWTSTDKTNWTEWVGAEVAAAQTGGTYNLYVRGDTSNTKIAGYSNWWCLDGSNIACTGNIETLRGATGDDPSPTAMAECCYGGMFLGCMSLTSAPDLPAMTLAAACYWCMFGYTSLTEAPALPATVLREQCYEGMFECCTLLTAAPALPATNLASRCYDGMFSDCTSLIMNQAAPGKEWKISATNTTASSWGDSMFLGTGGDVPSTPELNTTYYNVVSNPLTLTAQTTDSTVAFSWASGYVRYAKNGGAWTDYTKGETITLANAGDTVAFWGWQVVTDKNNYFTMSGKISASGSVTSLIDGNGGNPSVTLPSACFACLFRNCAALTTAPELPATTLANYCYYSMFSGCTSLTNAPALPALTLVYGCYDSMFNGCTLLTAAPALPATTLAYCCYWYMFSGCTSLKDVPKLPAMTLAYYCYDYMFFGCTALEVNTNGPGKEWKIPAITESYNWGEGMFAMTAGTLQDQPELNTTYYIASALPKGSEVDPWQIGAGLGDTVNAWTNGTGTLVVEGAGKMKAFASDGSDVPWPTGEIAAVEISGEVTSIGQNAWHGLGDGVTYNGLSATAAKTMGDGFGGTAEYGRVAFKEFQVDGGSVQATVALETAKSLTNEWTEVELTAGDVHVENGRIVIQHETDPQTQGFYLMQPVK